MATYSGTPRTWSAGETVTAALMNSDVRDPLAALAGAWNSYTPTLTSFTPGNGTATGKYIRVGKLVMFQATFTFGSTSSVGSVAYGELTLPVTAAGAGWGGMGGAAIDASDGNKYYPLVANIMSSTTVRVYQWGSPYGGTSFSSSSPFSWTTSDIVRAWGLYEAA